MRPIVQRSHGQRTCRPSHKYDPGQSRRAVLMRFLKPAFAIVALLSAGACGNARHPVVGRWTEIEGNLLTSVNSDAVAVIEARPSGAFVITEGGRSVTYSWRSRDDGRVMVEMEWKGKSMPVGIVAIQGDELVLENQGGRARFRRAER